MIKRIKARIELWQRWRGVTMNNAFYNFLVLIGIKKDSTFDKEFLDEIDKDIGELFVEKLLSFAKTENTCVHCGAIIPEGRLDCPICAGIVDR